MQVLETKLVQGLGAEHLRVAHLQSVFVAVGVEALRSKIQLPDPAVGEIVVEKLIANREDIVGAQLKVKARTQVGQSTGAGDGLAQRSCGERGGVEDKRGHDGVVPMSRRKKVKKNEAFLLSGPPTLPLKKSV